MGGYFRQDSEGKPSLGLLEKKGLLRRSCLLHVNAQKVVVKPYHWGSNGFIFDLSRFFHNILSIYSCIAYASFAAYFGTVFASRHNGSH